MQKICRFGRWAITFICVHRAGMFHRYFKIDKQKGKGVFLITLCINKYSLYIRRGWIKVNMPNSKPNDNAIPKTNVITDSICPVCLLKDKTIGICTYSVQ